MTFTEGPTLPDYDTIGHYVLHSIIRHCSRQGLDYRLVSEIAAGMKHSRQEIEDALVELEASGVIRRAELGLRLLAKCNHKVAEAELGKPTLTDCTFGQFGSTANVQVRDKFPEKAESDLTDPKKSRRLRLQRSDECDSSDNPCVWVDNNFPTSINSSTEDAEWRGLPGILKGPHLTKGRAKSTPGPDTSLGLAKYFQQKCREGGVGKGAPSANLPALAKNLTATKADGIEPAQIRAMIDRFTANPAWSRGKEPWKVFLKMRPQLLEVTKRAAVKPPAGMTEDEERAYWGGPLWKK